VNINNNNLTIDAQLHTHTHTRTHYSLNFALAARGFPHIGVFEVEKIDIRAYCIAIVFFLL
jgi:hypothetical protein